MAAKCQIVVEKRKISGCRQLGFRSIEKVSRVDANESGWQSSLSAQAGHSWDWKKPELTWLEARAHKPFHIKK